MDYKEKYEQALAKAKDMLNYKEVRQEDMEYLFPELKESEDEKIRTKLTEFFAGYTTDEEWWGSITEKDILAWLEKQGEQKSDNHAQWSDEEELHIKELESLVKKVWAIAECENDKDTIREMRDLSFFLKTLNPEKKGEQKPAEWDDDDEGKISSIMYLLHTLGNNKFDNWLKSLKDIVQPQSHWKPSEEQIKALERECFAHSNYNLCRLLEQLKKLKG